MTSEDHPDLRASDRERERTIDELRDAAGEGRLTFEELADRIEVAADAKTRGELEQLTRDLPGTAVTPATSDGQIVVDPKQSSVFGDMRRSGPWVVPEHSAWRSYFGDVVLDLREARVSAPEVTIDASTVFGDIELLVPEGVLVELRTRTTFGKSRHQAGETAPAGAPRVILTGGTVFGDVRVRAQRLRDRIAGRLLGRGSRG